MESSQIIIAVVVLSLIFVAFLLIAMFSDNQNLNNIKSRPVGDGQHGTARWSTEKEIQKTFTHVKFDVANWRKGENLPTAQGLIVGCKSVRKNTIALVDEQDIHGIMLGAAGVGKTAFFLYPNLEYACASGMSFLTSDTKGDLARTYGKIAKDYYSYNVSIIDLRNPTRSDGNNMLNLVNKYMDLYLETNLLSHKAKAEKYAKILAKTIIGGDEGGYGQNAFFYDAAEGILTATILIVSEFCSPLNYEKYDKKLLKRLEIKLERERKAQNKENEEKKAVKEKPAEQIDERDSLAEKILLEIRNYVNYEIKEKNKEKNKENKVADIIPIENIIENVAEIINKYSNEKESLEDLEKESNKKITPEELIIYEIMKIIEPLKEKTEDNEKNTTKENIKKTEEEKRNKIKLAEHKINRLAKIMPEKQEFHEKRHIISVFKIIQDLLAPSKERGKNQFQVLIDFLPPEHKARWFAGASLNSAEQSMASVLSTAMSRLNAFLDSELEQILCFDTAIDAENFCNTKSAIFVILPEEDNTKFFMVSLIVQQLYREILSVADENGGKLKNRVMFYLDEFGTLPKIDSAEMMFSASRSRRVSIIPIIQSFAQLEKNYGKEGSQIILDNCQVGLYAGFSPNSESAKIVSEQLGNETVLTGSISKGKNEASRSLQMTQKPLMSPDQLRTMEKGNFIITKTGFNPMKSKFKLFLDWGITFTEDYQVEEKSERRVYYADKEEIEKEITKKYSDPYDEEDYEDYEDYEEEDTKEDSEKNLNDDESKNNLLNTKFTGIGLKNKRKTPFNYDKQLDEKLLKQINKERNRNDK